MPPNLSPPSATGATSWWWDEALSSGIPNPDCPPLSGSATADVIIVGGGYAGLWTALALKQRQPKLQVRLIEAHACGSGASGKNGGLAHGYWSYAPSLIRNFGTTATASIIEAGTRAQQLLQAFAQSSSIDVWWRGDGMLKVATCGSHDEKIHDYLDAARQLDNPSAMVALCPASLTQRIASPAFSGGILLREGATVHPARLALSLKQAVLRAGVVIHERTPMLSMDRGSINIVYTPSAQLTAPNIVLATNVGLARDRRLSRHLCVFSSYAIMTEPRPAALADMNWQNDPGMSDMRMFLHYFRRTPDGRVLMGSGSGPIAYGNDDAAPRLYHDDASIARATSAVRRLLPGMAGATIAKAWGGAIDVSSDRLPLFGSEPNGSVHFACGFSGHGVNATCLAGHTMASLVLQADDYWTRLPFCTRQPPSLPPEPWRTLGGRCIRKAIMHCEQAEHDGRAAAFPYRLIADMPGKLGLRIGVR